MTTNQSIDVERVRGTVREAVRHHWALFLIEGLALVILGLLAILLPAVASLVATVFFGWLLLLSGIVGMIATIRARRAPGFAWSLASAIAGIVAGVLLLALPPVGTFSLTAVLIAFLLVEGSVSILYGLDHRKSLSGRWGWMLASGVADVVLGLILLAGLPGTAVWALGLLVGINMLFGGWALIWMALYARSEPSRVPA
jgi:uncharacterized membrane protein HdeD (DUF308 family)